MKSAPFGASRALDRRGAAGARRRRDCSTGPPPPPSPLPHPIYSCSLVLWAPIRRSRLRMETIGSRAASAPRAALERAPGAGGIPPPRRGVASGLSSHSSAISTRGSRPEAIGTCKPGCLPRAETSPRGSFRHQYPTLEPRRRRTAASVAAERGGEGGASAPDTARRRRRWPGRWETRRTLRRSGA